jgi:colanic acid biosynthesis glycosyl transferase WcaI
MSRDRARSVAFFNRFYWPDYAATAQILHDLAEHLAGRDWSVDVISAAAEYAADGTTLPRAERHNNVSIWRTTSPRADRRSAAGSLAEYGAYTKGAVARLLRLQRPSIVVAMSDPPMLGAALLPVARVKRSRFVHWVQDIHPEIASRVGPLPSSGPVYHGLEALARATSRGADLTVTIGPAMAAHLVKTGAPEGKIAVIPNWIDTDALRPVPRATNALAAELGVGDRFVVLYSGNAGRAHPFDTVLGAMERLKDDGGVEFLFIGGGPGLAELRRDAATRRITNARFLDYLPRERIVESHSLAAACLVTESTDVAGLLFPSKSIGIIACARPLLFVGDDASEVAALVRTADCGRVLAHGDADGLVREINRLRTQPDEAARLGANGRRAAVRQFDARVCLPAWERTLEALL